MKNSVILYIIFIVCSLRAHAADTYADKQFYLVDSLELRHLSPSEKVLLDSLLTLYPNAESGMQQLEYLDQIVQGIYSNEVWTKYNQKIMVITESLLKDDPDNKIVLDYKTGALNDMGYSLVENNPINAISFYEKALEIWKQIEDSSGIANVHNNLGTVYGKLGDIQKSLDYFHQSLVIREAIGNKQGVATCLLNISHIYDDQDDKKKAIEYLQRALGIFKELDYLPGICTSLNNIGAVYTQINELDKAIEMYDEAIDVAKEGRVIPMLVTSYNNLGSLYAKQKGEHLQALEYYNNALELLQKVDYARGLATVYHNIGKSYLELDEIDKAIEYGEKSMVLAKELAFPNELKNAANLLSLAYERSGNTAKALEQYKFYIQMRDSLNNINTEKIALKKNLEYEFEKKALLQEKEHDNELALAEAGKKRQNLIIIAIVIIALLTFIFLLVFVNRLKITRKQKVIIEKKNKENELLLGEIHHRVKNNLQMISSLLNLQQRNVEDPGAKQAIIDGRNRVISMALVHKKLYQHDQFSSIEMLDYTKQLAEELLSGLGSENQHISLDVQMDNVKLDVDTAVPIGLIINELLVNSLKYAFQNIANPQIHIRMNEANGSLQLDYSDNGAADDHVLEKMNSSSSFGTKMIASLTRQLKGEQKVFTQDGLHYMFTFKEYIIRT